MSDSLQPHGLYLPRLLCPWNFPGKNAGVGCHFLLQGIFPTEGLNPCLLLSRWILYHWATREAQIMLKLCLFGNEINLCSTLYFLSNYCTFSSPLCNTKAFYILCIFFCTPIHSLTHLEPGFHSCISIQADITRSVVLLNPLDVFLLSARVNTFPLPLFWTVCPKHPVKTGLCLSVPSSIPVWAYPLSSFTCQWRLELFMLNPLLWFWTSSLDSSEFWGYAECFPVL